MVRYLIGLLSVWYGRTTWWKILLRIFIISRKIFIIINAVIGIYVVYKLAGFEVGLMLSHITTMGQTYIEIFTNFTKRLFEWFLDFLGYDLGPKKPNIPSNHINRIWSPVGSPIDKDAYNPILKDYFSTDSLRNSYKSLLNINVEPVSTSWYRDLNTWLWIGGIISVIGFTYLGYKFIMDPSFFSSDLTPTIRRPRAPGELGTDILNPTPTITENIINGIKGASNKAISGIKLLNPYSWFTSANDHADLVKVFNKIQTSDRYDDRYFPFTPIHPYDPWYTNLKLHIFGESQSEYLYRIDIKNKVLKSLINIPSPNDSLINLPPVSPHIGSVGLGTRYTSGSGLYEKIDATTSAAIVNEKLSFLPNTPNSPPLDLPDYPDTPPRITKDFEAGELGGWNEHTVPYLKVRCIF
jgi:hypothetical protein